MYSLRVGAFAFAVRSALLKPSLRWNNVAGLSSTPFINDQPITLTNYSHNDEVEVDNQGDYLPQNTFSSKISIKPGTVYFVSTPIGNLDDISVRAMKVLRSVDVIAAEDTRRTGLLLHLLGIETRTVIEKRGGKGGPSLLSHHEHNFKRKIPDILDHVHNGRTVAVVSDAGTPGISDPGMELAEACASAGVPLVPIPGACAAVAAISVSGFPSSEFVFLGFLPRKGSELRKKIEEISAEERTCIFYEAPHRVAKTLQRLSEVCGTRPVLIAREITKLHEELFRGTLLEGYNWAANHEPRGEFTIVLSAAKSSHIEPQDKMEKEQESLLGALEKVKQLMLESDTGGKPWALSMAVQHVARDMKLPKRLLYKLAVDRLK